MHRWFQNNLFFSHPSTDVVPFRGYYCGLKCTMRNIVEICLAVSKCCLTDIFSFSFPFSCLFLFTHTSLNHTHLLILQEPFSHDNYIWYKKRVFSPTLSLSTEQKFSLNVIPALIVISYALSFAGANPLCQAEQEEYAQWYLKLRCSCHLETTQL